MVLSGRWAQYKWQCKVLRQWTDIYDLDVHWRKTLYYYLYCDLLDLYKLSAHLTVISFNMVRMLLCRSKKFQDFKTIKSRNEMAYVKIKSNNWQDICKEIIIRSFIYRRKKLASVGNKMAGILSPLLDQNVSWSHKFPINSSAELQNLIATRKFNMTGNGILSTLLRRFVPKYTYILIKS